MSASAIHSVRALSICLIPSLCLTQPFLAASDPVGHARAATSVPVLPGGLLSVRTLPGNLQLPSHRSWLRPRAMQMNGRDDMASLRAAAMFQALQLDAHSLSPQ